MEFFVIFYNAFWSRLSFFLLYIINGSYRKYLLIDGNKKINFLLTVPGFHIRYLKRNHNPLNPNLELELVSLAW